MNRKLISFVSLTILFLSSCNWNSDDKKIEDLGIELAKAKAKKKCKEVKATDKECQEFTDEVLKTSVGARRKMIEDANNLCKSKNSSGSECSLMKGVIIVDLEWQIKEALKER